MKDDKKPAPAGKSAIVKRQPKKPAFDPAVLKGPRGAGKHGHQTSARTQPVFKPRGR